MVEAMALEQARSLTAGKTIYSINERNNDGIAKRFKVTSAKTWKREPNRIRVRLKGALNRYYELDADDLKLFSLTEPEKVSM